MLGRVFPSLCLAAVCALAGMPSAAQQTSKVMLDTSETVFSVIASINHCGYGSEPGPSEPMRAQIRRDIAKAVASSPDAQAASEEICAFYRDHQQPDSGRDLAQYVSLALNLGEAPKFTPKVKEADLPPDAAYVLGLVPLLERFYQAAGLGKIWKDHQYQYDGLIQRYHTPVADMLVATDVYLRLPISGYLGRSFTVYLEPMAAPGQVNSRNYGADYYMVVSPAGDTLRMKEIRHTYLHFILDPLILKRAGAMKRMEPLLRTVQTAPLEETYKKDISLLVTESLIRAVEARLAGSGKAAEPTRLREANAAMAEGFILTRYFFDQLIKFEGEATGARDALPDWLYYLDVDKERKRAEEVQFSSNASPEVMRAARPQPSVLDLAEQRLAAGDFTSAQKIAQRALDEHTGDAGRALFILAQAATLNKDMAGARNYFERTIQVAKEPRLQAWSHIYLGRISDLQEDREAAVQHYQAALAVHDVSPETKAAAERGLKEPYQPRRQ